MLYDPRAGDKGAPPFPADRPRRVPVRASVERWIESCARYEAYRMPAVAVDSGARLTTEARRQADLLFDLQLRPALPVGAYKLDEKRTWFHYLYHAWLRAL